MATRKVSIRLALENQQQVERGLDEVGNKGQRALKKIDEATKPTIDSTKKHTESVRLQAHQIGNLNQQLIDVAVQLQGGQNPFTILTQQGPQVVFAVGGMRNAVSLLARAFTPMGLAVSGGALAFAAFAAGVGLAGSKIAETAAEARGFETILRGMGAQALVSTDQLREMVKAMRALDAVSAEDARGALGAALRVPGVTGAGLNAVQGLAGDFAAAFGASVEDAGRKIAELSSRGLPAIEDLQKATNLLTAEQYKNVVALAEQGRGAEAVDIAIAALTARIDGLALKSLSDMGRAAHDAGVAWDGFKQSLADGVFGEIAVGAVGLITSALHGFGNAIQAFSGAWQAAPYLQIVQWEDDLAVAIGKRAAAQEKLNAIEAAGRFGFTVGVSRIENERLRDANAEVDRLEKLIAAKRAALRKPDPDQTAGPAQGATAQELFIQKANKEYENQLKILSAVADQREIIRAGIEAEAKGAAANLNPDQLKAYIALEKERAQIKVDTNNRDKAAAEAEREAESAAKKAQADAIKARKEEADWLFRIIGLIEKDVEAWEKKNAQLPEYIAGLEQQQRLAGLTAEAREEELAVIKAAELAVHGLSEADEARVRSIVRATNAQQAGIEAAKKAAEESARAWEKATDRLKDSITDSIFRGFENGESAAKIFFDTVKRTLLTSAIQIPVNFLVDAGAGLLRSALGQGGGGGAGGALGMAGNAASLGNFFSGGSLSAGLSAKLFGTGAVGAMGPQIPTSGLLGSGGFTGAMGGSLPYIGAAVAAFGIAKSLGLIGGGRTVGSNAGGRVAERDGMFVVEGVGGDRNKGVDLIPQVTDTLSAAATALNEFTRALGTPQSGGGAGVALQLFASGKNPINTTAAELIAATINAGVIEGLTQAEQAIISSAADVFVGMEQVLSGRAFPKQIADRLKQMKDPTGFQLDQLKIEEDALIAQASTLTEGMEKTIADIREIFSLSRAKISSGLDGIAADWNALGDAVALAAREARAANDNFDALGGALDSIASASKAAIDGLQSTADSLQAFLTGLDSGPLSALNIDQQYRAAKAAFSANANPETARTLLELSKQRDPGIGFARDSAQIRQLFGNIIAGTPGLIAAEQDRASVFSTTYQQSMADKARTLGIEQIRSISAGLNSAAGGGGYAEGRADLAQSAQNLLTQFTEILRTGGEFNGSIIPQGFYRAAFPNLFPGFANGGMTPANRPFIVGENGPEIMQFPRAGHVTPNGGFDNGATVAELKEVKARLERLDAALVSIATRTVDMESRQRKWDTTGLLTRTA